MRKDELLRYLRKKEAPEAELSDKRVPELRELCRKKYPAPTVADILAKNYGYDVLWLPPYHPAFNPIENAWGIEKGYVAWTNDGSSFEDVKDMILDGFDQVTPEIWENLVFRCYRNEDSYISTGKPLIEVRETPGIIDIESEDESDEEVDEEEEEDEEEEYEENDEEINKN
jgi:transposase